MEKSTDIKIKCHKCGNEYVMSMMRMDPKSSTLTCRNCLERKPIQKQETKETKAEKEGPMKEYFCKSCKYNFKRAKHIVVSTCPYCSSKSINVKGSTARIMAEAFRMKGE